MVSQTKVESITGFHIEPTNLCTLKCPGCARTRFINQWGKHWKNHSLDIDAILNFLDVDLANKQITLCGNYGDPIYHPDLIKMVSEFKTRGSNILIHTNGSYQKSEWWENLCDLLDHHDKIVFSVDGAPDNFTQYRINADWESIHVAMQVVAKSKCNSTWKYIPFVFNQSDIERTRELSQEIGIDDFVVRPSDRFDEQTEYLKPIDIGLLGPRYNQQTTWKQNNKLSVDPLCNNGSEYFISADGFYSPCCYSADHRFYYKNIFGKNKERYDIRNTTLTKILSSDQVIEFYKTLQEKPVCQFNCPNTTHKK